jgi:glycosyltransferase involved in cell wall biosynthesis
MAKVIALSIVVPAFNEAARLPPTLAAVRAGLAAREPGAHELLVVDDGSTDDTAAVARQGGARVISLPRNLGKGAAVRAGLLEATGEVIAFMDADGSIPFAEVERLVGALRAGAAIAVASRVAPGGGEDGERTALRELASGAFRTLCAAVLPTGVRDTQCGAKAFGRSAARALAAAQTLQGFAFDAELLWLARLRGLAVVEVPVRVRHDRASKVGMLRHAGPMLADLVRVRLRHRRSSNASAASTPANPPR